MPEIERLSPAEKEFLDLARRDGLVAVIRAEHVADPGGLVEALVSAGIRCIEFTLTTKGALDAVEQTAQRGVMVGAGTILEVGHRFLPRHLGGWIRGPGPGLHRPTMRLR